MSGVVRVARPPYVRAALAIVSIAFAALLSFHVCGVLLDYKAVINYVGELDYGEGIVWQQAVLMLGPHMYSPSQDLPFIVFHYPPLYYLAVRSLMALQMDPLAAGRLVSMLSTLASAAIVGALVLASVRRRPTPADIAIAVSAGAVMLLPNAVRTWAVLMRVDMLAIALGLGGTLVAVRSRGRLGLLALALLLCLASVFTKQTQLPAGVSVFFIGMLCWRRTTLLAAAIALAAGVGAVALLQAATHGFLQNIIGYNLNAYNWNLGLEILWRERSSAPFVLLMGIGTLLVCAEFCSRAKVKQLQRGEPALVARAVAACHFVLACLMAPAVFKEGSNVNYLLDLLTSGSVMIGILLCDALRRPLRFVASVLILALGTANLPYQHYYPDRLAEWTQRLQPLIASIRAAKKPVASEYMTLVMRAGKSLVFEPAIAEQLIAMGRWDPAALLKMVHDHGFEFVITHGPQPMGGPVLGAALAASYPRVETPIPGTWVRFPPADPQPGRDKAL